MVTLRTMNAAETEPLAILHVPEHELHELFKEHRHHGEWFHVSERMIGYFLDINEIHPAARLRRTLEEQNEA